jgi:DNA polymerase
MSRLWIDIETRSRVDLKKTGVYRYVRDPDFRILMASWSTDRVNIQTAFSHDEIRRIPGLFDVRVTKVAHNAAFERVCFSQFLGGVNKSGYIDPQSYHDTQAVAGELGYPQSLAKLAVALGAQPKDEAGTLLINTFSKPNRAGGWNDHTTHPLKWLDFIAYCEQDVATLIECDELLGDFPTETERSVFFVDQYINDRGIRVDTELAQLAVAAGTDNEQQQKARVTEVTGVDNPGSVQQLSEWLGVPDLRAESVTKLLEGDISPEVREVLELRQELALAAPKKFATALESHVDGRLHGTLRFFGAHTGRWAGRGIQLQNLTREQFDDEDQLATAILDLQLGGGASSLTLKRLVRPLFLGPFTVVDYAAIEARVIAWLAGEEWVLEAARAGRDLYVETAERMGGLTRSQGKVAVLALGYNGGPGSLRAMAGDRDYLPDRSQQSNGENHTVLGIITGEQARRILDATDDELYGMFVNPWRAANPAIVRLWRLLEDAFQAGGSAGEHLSIEKDGDSRLLRLPSGRAIAYRQCGYRPFLNKKTGETRRQLSFMSAQGYPVNTYGGRLAENATQAVARDILAEALVRLEERRGYPVVGHVHDEILVEGEHDVDTVAKIMCEPPIWAAGLPIDGEGFVCDRYRKG